MIDGGTVCFAFGVVAGLCFANAFRFRHIDRTLAWYFATIGGAFLLAALAIAFL